MVGICDRSATDDSQDCRRSFGQLGGRRFCPNSCSAGWFGEVPSELRRSRAGFSGLIRIDEVDTEGAMHRLVGENVRALFGRAQTFILLAKQERFQETLFER